jgi:hypothetical protein
MTQDKWMRREGNYIILVNVKRARPRHWNEEVKIEKSKVKAANPPPHLLLDVNLPELGDIKGSSACAFLCEMLISNKSPGMGRGMIKGNHQTHLLSLYFQ